MIVAPGGRPIRSLLILGFGVTGRAVAEFAAAHRVRALISEGGSLGERARTWLDARGVPFEEGGHTERFLGQAEAVVLSPGVRADEPVVRAAEAADLPVLSELDLATLQVPSLPVVAVTGTNGKGTTVVLIDEILRQAGWHSTVGGNIGTPFVSLLDGVEELDVIVLEASSYQLEQTRFLKPRVAALLNLTPDHLKRHGTMAAYAAAKGRLFRRQEPDDVAVLPMALAAVFDQGSARRIFFDAREIALPPGADHLAPHNRLNLAAAVCAACAFNPSIDPKEIDLSTLESAFHLPHRMEEVGRLDGVRIVNDSKSTNADSAVAALRSTDGPAVLLLGGRSKGAGYEALADEIRRRAVRQEIRSVVLFGEAAAEFEIVFAGAGAVTERASSLEEAVDIGLAAAAPGDSLLLSPACSSFDAFRNYEARGNAFVEVVRARPGFEEAESKDAGG